MTTSQVGNVLAATAALLAADANLVAASVPTYDGPTVSQASNLEYVVVGHDPSGESTVAASTTQDWRSDGGAAAFRDETITFPVTVVVRGGDTDIVARRARAYVLAGYVEAALRANYTLGLAQVAWLEIADQTLHQVAAAEGSIVYVESTVRVRAVI